MIVARLAADDVLKEAFRPDCPRTSRRARMQERTTAWVAFARALSVATPSGAPSSA